MLAIHPTTRGTEPGFFIGPGVCGTGVFVRSGTLARLIHEALLDEAAGRLTAAERWQVIDALVREDEWTTEAA